MIKKTRNKFKSSSVGRATLLLSRNDQVKVIFVMILQTMFGLLDLLGIAIVGILGALSIRGVQSETPGDKVSFC